jgi:hypothetical protein
MTQYETAPRRTNCWTVVLIIEGINLLINLIVAFSQKNAGNIVNLIITLILFVIFMFHLQWTKVEITDSHINIISGPLNWPFFHWIFTSQIPKEEVASVERHERSCWDIFPLLYCHPVNWCCQHKSYSGYVWPFCCLCCDEQRSDQMVKITLNNTKFRWAPCPCPCSIFWCCKYSIVSVTVQDPHEVMLQISNAGYNVPTLVDNNNVKIDVTSGGQEGYRQV